MAIFPRLKMFLGVLAITGGVNFFIKICMNQLAILYRQIFDLFVLTLSKGQPLLTPKVIMVINPLKAALGNGK